MILVIVYSVYVAVAYIVGVVVSTVVVYEQQKLGRNRGEIPRSERYVDTIYDKGIYMDIYIYMYVCMCVYMYVCPYIQVYMINAYKSIKFR